MKVAKLTDVKNDLSRFVERVQQGESIRILVRGVPAADLVPIERAGSDEELSEAELRDLERRGIIQRGSGGWSRGLDRPGPRVKRKRAVEYLLQERRRR